MRKIVRNLRYTLEEYACINVHRVIILKLRSRVSFTLQSLATGCIYLHSSERRLTQFFSASGICHKMALNEFSLTVFKH